MIVIDSFKLTHFKTHLSFHKPESQWDIIIFIVYLAKNFNLCLTSQEAIFCGNEGEALVGPEVVEIARSSKDHLDKVGVRFRRALVQNGNRGSMV